MKRALLLIVVLPGCDSLLANLVGALLVLLGIAPMPGFTDTNSNQYGQMEMALQGVDPDALEITADGQPAEVEGIESRNGFSKGSFVMLVDGSGSNENTTSNPADCPGCPTDPARRRVEAVKQLAKELHQRAPEWRVSIVEFRSEEGSTEHSRVIQGFTTDTDQLVSASDLLGSVGGTPLWDATFQVLDSLEVDLSQHFQTTDPDVGRGLVVLSDGQDTTSDRSLSEVVERARSVGIPVHVVGLGAAADVSENFSAAAVNDLRRLATDTGGFYGSVERPDELPALFTKIADSLANGYERVTVRHPDPPASGEVVEGTIGLAGTTAILPFRFIAP